MQANRVTDQLWLVARFVTVLAGPTPKRESGASSFIAVK